MAGELTWETIAGGGDVSATGDPSDNEFAKWTNATTIEGITLAALGAELEGDMDHDNLQNTHSSGDSHAAGSDTTLGTMTADIDMDGTYQVVGLQEPDASGQAIRATAKITEAKMEAADDHVGDNSQAHTDYLLNSGADVAAGPLTITADNSSADQAYVPMVLYNTDETPPAASGFPVGTLYVQYTA